jgi:hypothetical protein
MHVSISSLPSQSIGNFKRTDVREERSACFLASSRSTSHIANTGWDPAGMYSYPITCRSSSSSGEAGDCAASTPTIVYNELSGLCGIRQMPNVLFYPYSTVPYFTCTCWL